MSCLELFLRLQEWLNPGVQTLPKGFRLAFLAPLGACMTSMVMALVLIIPRSPWALTLFAVLTVNTLVNLVLSASTDPGYVEALPSQPQENLPPARFCSHCEAYKPPRAHHCRRCSRCVMAMDHHCVFIHNCVGAGNRKFFVLTLYYGLLQSMFVILVAPPRIASIMQSLSAAEEAPPPLEMLAAILSLCTLCQCVGYSIVTLGLAAFQTKLLVHDETTIEFRSHMGARPYLRSGAPREGSGGCAGRLRATRSLAEIALTAVILGALEPSSVPVNHDALLYRQDFAAVFGTDRRYWLLPRLPVQPGPVDVELLADGP